MFVFHIYAHQVMYHVQSLLPASLPLFLTGECSTILEWYMQSTALVNQDVVALSSSGLDVSSWYRVGSHGTIMVGEFPLTSCRSSDASHL